MYILNYNLVYFHLKYYLCILRIIEKCMKAVKTMKLYSEREKKQTIDSMLVSFKLEGIMISEEKAQAIYQKVQSRLQDSAQ